MQKIEEDNRVGLIEKFTPPILIGAFLGLVVLFLTNYLHAEFNDTIVSIPFIIVITGYLIKQKRGPKLKQNLIGKIYNYLFEKDKYELNVDKFDLRNYHEDNPIIIYYSTAFINNSIFWSVILVPSSFFLIVKGLWITGLGMDGLLIYNTVNKIKNLGDRTPQLLISRNGIATTRLGLINWGNIKHFDIIDKGSEGSSYYLEIYLSEKDRWTKSDESLYLEDLDISVKKLRKMIDSRGTILFQ